mgnify:FL=1
MLIHPYSASWNSQFDAIKNILDEVLQGIDYRIEHVGSTAVPGLAAKPIIDIDIVYKDPFDFQSIKTALEAIGYSHNGNQGIEDREVFKRKEGAQHEVLDSLRHHLYVCSADSPALKRHLITRDYLRNNEWAKAEYQQLKYDLAENAGQDQKSYAALKELHVNQLIDRFYPTTETPTESNEPTESTENMEVHHHAHHDHGKKTWKSYFWEFFMLFLAVFCGFLAEIQVEHYVEHQKEKKYMADLMEDIKSDTSFIHWELSRMKNQLRGYDSLTANLNAPDFTLKIPTLYRQLNNYSALLTPFLRDQTITQLRSSGNLRLISNDSIVKQINQYWAWRDVINKVSERTEQRIQSGLELSSKIFDRWSTDSTAIQSNDFAESPLLNTPNEVYPENLKLLTNDMSLIKQYSNYRITISQSARVYLWALGQMEKDGIKLKQMIENEYGLAK